MPRSLPAVGLPWSSLVMNARGIAPVSVTCPRRAIGRCHVRVTLRTTRGLAVRATAGRQRRRVITLGKRRESIALGKTTSVRIKVSPQSRRLLRRLKRVRVRVRVVTRDGGGRSRTDERTTLLRLAATSSHPRL
jgi:hypothetical protein